MGTDPFLADVEAAPLDEGASEGWTKPTRDGHTFVLPACQRKPCRLRYRVLLRQAAKQLDDIDSASEEGDVIVSPPSTWLLTPPRVDNGQSIRFRVRTPPAVTFATGVYRSLVADDAWDITLGDLWTSPYSAFGPLRIRTTKPAGARIDVAFGPGKLGVSEDDFIAFVERCEKAIVGYYGQFPMREALLIIIPGRGDMMGEGRTLGGGGGTIFLRVGERTTKDGLERDWVLTHEMVHLTFPTLERQHHWAEEGVATYVEPFARARIGWLTPEEAWKGVVEGVPNGLPAAGDQGLDRTPTWGRTYWGGALFFLYADVMYRRQSKNTQGLEHALQRINKAGANDAVRWPIEKAFSTADTGAGAPGGAGAAGAAGAAGTTGGAGAGFVLTNLYKEWKDRPVTPDLPKLWKDLGVIYTNGKVTFDDQAPDAAIRRAITQAN